MSIRLSVMVIGACLAASAVVAHADVYKWTDADGHVHYGDQAKNGAEKVKTLPDNAEAAQAADRDEANDKQQAQHVEDCGHKRDQLMTYKNATRVVETDSLGHQKEYSEAERQKLVELTQKQITDGCADVPEKEKGKPN